MEHDVEFAFFGDEGLTLVEYVSNLVPSWYRGSAVYELSNRSFKTYMASS